MTDKVFIIFLINVLPDVYICSHRKKRAPLVLEGTVKCTHIASSIANSQKMQTEINESSTIAKIQNKDISRKAFRIISNEMKISLLIPS